MRDRPSLIESEIVRRPVAPRPGANPPGYERVSADRSHLAWYAVDDAGCIRTVAVAIDASELRLYPGPSGQSGPSGQAAPADPAGRSAQPARATRP